MSVINTNITSMIGQQNLSKSQNALTTSMERLSSGLRINSAKDDAAGQAIANRMSAQINGLAQAQRNANDGISMAQTAEGGLNQINDNLQRIRELSVQAQNDTNSADDLGSIQDEIDQRLEEIDRISRETDFNGTKVLESDGALKIQVGSEDGQSIEVNLREINRETLGLQGFNVDGTPTKNAAASLEDVQAAAGTRIATTGNEVKAGDVNADYTLTTENTKLSGSDVLAQLSSGDAVTYAGKNLEYSSISTQSAATIKADGEGGFTYNTTITNTDVTAGALNLTPDSGTQTITWDVGGKSTELTIDSAGNVTTDGNSNPVYITSKGQITDNAGTGTILATADNLAAALNNDSGTNSFDVGATGNVKATLQDGTQLSNTGASAGGGAGVTVTGATVSAEDFIAAAAADGSSPITIANGTLTGQTASITIQSENNVDMGGAIYQDSTATGFAITASAEVTDNLFLQEDGTFNTAADGNGSTLNVTESGELTFEATSEGGRTADPLSTLDTALKTVDSLRSELGAVQNRFESAITNLSTNETNLSAARSRIEDADYATEVANMTRAQILQQAGTSVLAQANQIPQGVLSLLG